MTENYFSLFNLSPAFDLDLKALESAYFAAQRQYHPDRFVGKSPDERLRAAQKSADVNEAYKALKHPLSCAKHLLALAGITVLDEANSTKPDMATLNEIMELQENLAQGDRAGTLAHIETLKGECLKTLASAFEKNDFETAKTSTIRLAYLYKLAA